MFNIFKRNPSTEEIDKYLDELFECIWNGTEQDRYYSWFRLVSHMRCWNYESIFISRAMARMNMCKENRSQSYIVNNGGSLVRVVEIS